MELDTLNLPLRIIKTFGCWITKKSSIFYIIYAAVMQFIFVYLFAFLMGMYIVNVSGVVDFADQISTFCTYISCSFKCVKIYLEADNLELLFVDVKKTIDKYGITKKYNKHIKRTFKLTKGYWAATFSTCFLAGFVPFIGDRLAYPMWIPSSIDGTVSYYSAAVYQWVGSLCYSAVNVMLDMMPVLLFGYYISLLEHLCDKIASISQQKHDKIYKQKELITCIKYQLKIIEHIRKTEKIFSGIIFIQGLFSSVILCTSSFALTELNLPEDLVIFIKFTTYMFAMACQIFIPCYYGTELKLTYDQLANSLFHSDWMHEDMEYRKSLIIIMEHLKKEMKIEAFGMVYIDLGNFGTICNSAYSLFSVFTKTS